MDKQQSHKAFFKTIIKESLCEILREEGILAQLKNSKQGEVSSKELTTERKIPVTRPKVDVTKESFFDDLDFDPLNALRKAVALKGQDPNAARVLAESFKPHRDKDDESDDDGVDISVIKRLLTKNN